MTNEEAIKRLEKVKNKYEQFAFLSFNRESSLDIIAIEFAMDSLKCSMIKTDCIDATFEEI